MLVEPHLNEFWTLRLSKPIWLPLLFRPVQGALLWKLLGARGVTQVSLAQGKHPPA